MHAPLPLLQTYTLNLLMKPKRCIFVFLAMLPALIFAQTHGHLEGSVTTSDGQPTNSIQVVLAGTTIGTATNNQGKFSLKAPAGSYTVVVSSINCHRKEYPVILQPGDTLRMGNLQLIENKRQLDEIVVTGQFEGQSVKNSVYKVKLITPEKIATRGATDLKMLLETEPGIRFTNDMATGESDIQLMGMSGQNVKVLLDGVPLIDRGATKQSLSQVDVNQIERIEIVEGPMSVIYGADALAGVINLISKKNHPDTISSWGVTARIQEESVGKEYNAFSGKGKHNQHAGLRFSTPKGWHAMANITRNDFGGWQGSYTGRAKQWKEKNQWLGQANAGWKNQWWDIWYRLDGLQESITGLGDVNELTQMATDREYRTTRLNHQLQATLRTNGKWSAHLASAYQDYTRKTETTTLNVVTNDRRLSLDEGAQDESVFTNFFVRATSMYKGGDHWTLHTGFDTRHDHATGARIQGEPTLSDYSVFATADLTWGTVLFRPGVRFSKNNVYNAPPVIPSLNIKWNISDKTDFRLSYARGFRAPSLRELYFWFFDASHSIKGNTDLKAEYSHSFNGTFTVRPVHNQKLRLTASVSPFYNQYHNLIGTAQDATDPSVTTYINIDRYKTAGATTDVSLKFNRWELNAGFSYIGQYNKFHNQQTNQGSKADLFEWSAEASTGILYRIQTLGSSLAFIYKFTGSKPIHELVAQNGNNVVRMARQDAFHWADLTLTQPLYKMVNLQAGVRNLFDVTSIANSQTSQGGHSSTGPTPIGYGRSYFVNLIIEI